MRHKAATTESLMRNRFKQVPPANLVLAKKVDRWLQMNFKDEDDSSVAAQSAAGEFDHEEWLDDETHWLWDLVAAWSENFAESITKAGAVGRFDSLVDSVLAEKGRPRDLVASIAESESGWVTPPEHQGQIIAVSYASDAEGVYKMVLDQSSRSSSYYFAPWDKVPERVWKKMSASKLPDDLLLLAKRAFVKYISNGDRHEALACKLGRKLSDDLHESGWPHMKTSAEAIADLVDEFREAGLAVDVEPGDSRGDYVVIHKGRRYNLVSAPGGQGPRYSAVQALARKLGGIGRGVLEASMRKHVVHMSNTDGDEDEVLLVVEGPGAAAWAKSDQTVLGSRWETDGKDYAYAIVSNEDKLPAQLKKNGYTVNDREWSPPE
jgi:hypothetical protein